MTTRKRRHKERYDGTGFPPPHYSRPAPGQKRPRVFLVFLRRCLLLRLFFSVHVLVLGRRGLLLLLLLLLSRGGQHQHQQQQQQQQDVAAVVGAWKRAAAFRCCQCRPPFALSGVPCGWAV